MYIISTPPADTPVTLETVKDHLKLLTTDEDSLIPIYIKAATEYAEKYLGRRLMSTGITEHFNSGYRCFKLSFTTTSTISTIHYLNKSGDWVVVPSDKYDHFKIVEPEEIVLLTGAIGSDLKTGPESIKVVYNSGYETADDVPNSIKVAIMLLVGEMFENRENHVKRLPTAADLLLRQFRKVCI